MLYRHYIDFFITSHQCGMTFHHQCTIEMFATLDSYVKTIFTLHFEEGSAQVFRHIERGVLTNMTPSHFAGRAPHHEQLAFSQFGYCDQFNDGSFHRLIYISIHSFFPLSLKTTTINQLCLYPRKLFYHRHHTLYVRNSIASGYLFDQCIL